MTYFTVISFSDKNRSTAKMLRFFNASWLSSLRRAATEWHDRRDELIPDGYTFAEEETDASAAWGWIAFPFGILLLLLIWWRFYPQQLRYDFLCLPILVSFCHYSLCTCLLICLILIAFFFVQEHVQRDLPLLAFVPPIRARIPPVCP